MASAPDIHIAQDGRDWAHRAAELLHRISEQTVQEKGRVLIALSGGSTPKTLYQTLASPDWKERFPWSRITFLFGDERCVPPDHPESNYGMVRAALFQPLGIDPERIHRMRGENPDHASAAREYEDTLRNVTRCVERDVPRLDLILLGLGDDGHIASLFPGTAALRDRSRLVAVGQAPKGIPFRLTLTLGVINRASVVLFLVTGTAKAQVVRAVLEPRSEADRALPAAMVAPGEGRLIWMLDRSAAAQLTGHRQYPGDATP
jgi:6-phosphogluconolactonase